MNNFLEIIIFFYVLQHKDLVESFKGEFFNTKYVQELFKVLKPFVLEYGTIPSLTQALDLIKLADKQDVLPDDIVTDIWKNLPKVNEYADDWLQQNAKSFAEWQNIMGAIRKVLTYTKTIQSDVTFENCSDYVERIKSLFVTEASFQIGVTSGHDFFDMSEHVIEDHDTWTTGYKFFDMCLNGGWAAKTLNVLMGSPKVGKSKWLCNLAANSVKNGDNIAYITLELSYKLVMQRIGSNLFKIPMKDYKVLSRDLEYMNNKAKEFRMSNFKELGEFTVEEFPTSSMTVNDLENFLLHKEEELSTEGKPFKYKNIFVDYVNIMKDKRNPNSENTYLKIKNICEDLRAMAQRNNWCVVSVTQTNRSGFDSTDMGMTSVSESAGLIATVDSLFGIIQNGLMRASGVYYIKGVAMRNSEHMGDKKKYKEVRDYLEIDEDPTEDIIREDVELPRQWNAMYQPVNGNSYQAPVETPTSAHAGSSFNLGQTEQMLNQKVLFR